MIEIRLRSRVHADEMAAKVGKVLTPSDANALLTGPARVYTPEGDLLCIYLPGALPEDLRTQTYPVLTTIRAETTNRGLASGSKRVRVRPGSKNTYARPVMSSILGAIEGTDSRFPACRLTAWTGEHVDKWAELFPLFRHVAGLFAEHVPDRYWNQAARAEATEPSWVIKGTPFTTVTVNNTYATGVHKDQGDLDSGFSCLAVLRRGVYEGGWLTFPEYRVAVDMQDGDVILMDAHQFHGNVALEKRSENAERISVVLYYRTDVLRCKDPDEERERAKRAYGGTL